MIRPDALIFDIDGTLWDAAAPTARGWNDALAELGAEVRVTLEDIRSVAGTPFVGCVEKLVPELCPPSESTLHLIDVREKEAIIESGGTLFPGVEDGLKRLACVYPLYVVSNCQDWYFDLFLESTGLAGHFAGGDCNGASGLSKSGMLQRLGREEGLANAVYVGDTRGDELSAQEAGMAFAFARYGFGSASATVLAFGSFEDIAEYYCAPPLSEC